jgi:hypothetical protein
VIRRADVRSGRNIIENTDLLSMSLVANNQ